MKQLLQTRLAGRRAVPLAACSSLGGGEIRLQRLLSLVRVHRVSVGDGSLSVVPPRPWNRHRPTFVRRCPRGRGLDVERAVSSTGSASSRGLKSGRYLIRQSKRADQQVPKFRSDMTAPEIAAMLETPVSGARRGGRFPDAVAAAAAVPRRQRLPARLSSISTATRCGARAARSAR